MSLLSNQVNHGNIVASANLRKQLEIKSNRLREEIRMAEEIDAIKAKSKQH